MQSERVLRTCKAYRLGYEAGIMMSGINPYYISSDEHAAWKIGYAEGHSNRIGKRRRHDDVIENIIEIEEE